MDSPQLTQERILALLQDLPPASLTVVEQFVQFLHDRAERRQPVVAEGTGESQPPYLYPTVPVRASVLNCLSGIMPPVDGDALADTEALYGDDGTKRT